MNVFKRNGTNSVGRIRNVSCRFGLLAVAVLLLIATAHSPARAAAPVPSLDIVPADAAFYSAMLRNREQYHAFVNSKAFAKIRDLPYVQMGLGLLQMQLANPDSPGGKIMTTLNDPEVKQSLGFLGAFFSDEVFVYGGADYNQAVSLMQGTYNEVYLAGLMEGVRNARDEAVNGNKSPTKDEELGGRVFVRALVKRIDLIKFPELVIGFKIKDKAVAKEELEHLETSLKMLLDQPQSPIKKDRLKRATIDGHSYLTLNLDGSMVPWDPEIVAKIHSLAETPDDGDKLIERLKKTTLVIALGIRDDYLLLTIAPSTDVLARLGKGKSLRTLPELAAVNRFAEKRICSVGYSSKSLNQHFGYTKADIDRVLKLGKSLLPSLPVPDKLREDLAKDADDLAVDLMKVTIPQMGATTLVAFLTDNGQESFNYDWNEHPELDSSKPLDLLKHIGGNPIAVLICRNKYSPGDYDLLVKWFGVGRRYFEKYGIPQLNLKPKEQAEFDKVYAAVKPLLGRLDKTTQNLLIPALADGQVGFVLDAKFTSRQFVQSLPMTEQPLTMFEPSLVVGVSDADKLRQAFEEYYAEADDFIKVLTADAPNPQARNFTIPRPKLYHPRAGTVYGYVLPQEWGVDGRVLPNAGLSDKVAVLSLSGKHTIRLLTESEPKIAGLSLSTDRPLASVAGFDFAAFVDALNPWVELALDKGTVTLQPETADMVRQHTKAVMEVLKVYRGTVSETYIEDKVTVTHSRNEYHDIDD